MYTEEQGTNYLLIKDSEILDVYPNMTLAHIEAKELARLNQDCVVSVVEITAVMFYNNKALELVEQESGDVKRH